MSLLQILQTHFSEIIQTIEILILGIVSIVLVSKGKKYLVAGVVAAVITLYSVLYYFRDAANALTSTSSIIASIIAAFAIILTVQQRKDAFNREKRDRNEQDITEIGQWAKNIIDSSKEKTGIDNKGKQIKRYVYSEIDDLGANLQVLNAQGQYIQQISSNFTSLKTQITDLNVKLSNHISLLEKQPVHPKMIAFGDWDKINPYLDELHDQRQQLVVICLKIIEEVGRLRKELSLSIH